ncbi:hypothetical protein D7B24_002320 [Verticillium nonalfalfae]|uniref:Mid2 domain-containing protein n=1 Tax=Verticillium nonalfalfae TaxID=1051616 RepID=A0A3M9Y153_9PEZI|nr:uncharacterized protein D7B24_002320 [Verticillium nonalfalfae]RNJ53128.1 hypothetical protein D7B24_002320 [Verticillium nonalfalfae]
MCLPSFRRKKQAPAPVEQTFNVLNRDLTPAVLTKHNAVHGGPANTNSAVTEWSYNRTSANTEASAPYCRTYAFPGGVRDYKCAPTPVAAIQSVEYTYSDQTDRQFETQTLSTDPESTSRDTTTASPSQTSDRSTPTLTSSPDPTTSAPAPEKRNSTPVGAIVGGTVGGVAVIVLLVLGVFLVRRRSSSATDVAPASAAAADHGPTSPMQQYQQQGYPSPPPQGDGYAGAENKSGFVSPVLSGYAAPVSPGYEGHQGLQQQQDINQMSQPYAAAGPRGTQQSAVYEMGLEGGHHKGQLHELH